MQIVKFPHPALFRKATPVTVFGEELKILLDAMYETMIKAHGLGLSANQVDLTLNAFVMQGPNEEKLLIVNPLVIARSQTRVNLEESCLSAPAESVVLKKRTHWVHVYYQDETGKRVARIFKGIYSVCVDHEMDHLAGRSFLQHKSIPKEQRKEFAKKYGKQNES
jgi:peptide deformylase